MADDKVNSAAIARVICSVVDYCVVAQAVVHCTLPLTAEADAEKAVANAIERCVELKALGE